MTDTAYIGLGANLGDREGNLRAALASLGKTAGVKVTAVSGFLENKAIGGPAGSPAFLNAAARVQTTQEPEELMARLLEIEREMGRERREKWGPRVIDLDLLLYGDRVIDTLGLKVPHPLMHTRRFVLEPLAEIAPDAIHPVLGKRILDLLAEL